METFCLEPEGKQIPGVKVYDSILLVTDDYSEGQEFLLCVGWVAGPYQAADRAVWR